MRVLSYIFPAMTLASFEVAEDLLDSEVIHVSELTQACTEVQVGLYTSTRGNAQIRLKVFDKSTLALSLHTSAACTDDVFEKKYLTYTLGRDCAISIHEVDLIDFESAVEEIKAADVGFAHLSTQTRLEYLPSVSAIQWGSLVLALDMKTHLDRACVIVQRGHYVKYVSGVTTVVRVLNGRELVLTVTLPLANVSGAESFTVAKVGYKMDHHFRITLVPIVGTRLPDFLFIQTVFTKIGSSKVFTMMYDPDCYEMRIGDLALEFNTGYLPENLAGPSMLI